MTDIDSTINKIKSILEKVKREKYFSYFDLDKKAKEFWQSWIDALRSGEFHQGKCALKTSMFTNSKKPEKANFVFNNSCTFGIRDLVWSHNSMPFSLAN